MSNVVKFSVLPAPIYVVNFNSNGGMCPSANKSVTYFATYGDLPTPSRTGYVFDGWYTDKIGGTKITADTM